MARDFIKIVREQREELKRLLTLTVLERLPMRRVDANSGLAQAVLGMRRSGKSVVCRRALAESGVAFGYVDFDDESF